MGFKFTRMGLDITHDIAKGGDLAFAIKQIMFASTRTDKIALAFSVPILADYKNYKYEDQLVYFKSITIRSDEKFLIIESSETPVDFDLNGIVKLIDDGFLDGYRLAVYTHNRFFCFDNVFRTDFKFKKPKGSFSRAYIFNTNIGQITFGDYIDDYDSMKEKAIRREMNKIKKEVKKDREEAEPAGSDLKIKMKLKPHSEFMKSCADLDHSCKALLDNRYIANTRMKDVPTLQDFYDLEKDENNKQKYITIELCDPVSGSRGEWFCYGMAIDVINNICIAFMTMDEHRLHLKHIIGSINANNRITPLQKTWKVVFYLPGYGFHCYDKLSVGRDYIHLNRYLGEFDITNYIPAEYHNDIEVLKHEINYLRYVNSHQFVLREDLVNKDDEKSEYISIKEHENILQNLREITPLEEETDKAIRQKQAQLTELTARVNKASARLIDTNEKIHVGEGRVEELNFEIKTLKRTLNNNRAIEIRKKVKPLSDGKQGQLYLSDIDGYYKMRKFFDAPHREYFENYGESCGSIFMIETPSSRKLLYPSSFEIDHKNKSISIKFSASYSGLDYNALIWSIYNEIFANGYNPLLPYKLKFIYKGKMYPALLCNGGITERTSDDYSKLYTWNFDDVPSSICAIRKYNYAYIIKLLDPSEEKEK